MTRQGPNGDAVAPLRFGDFAVDTNQRQITSDGAPIAVEPQVFEVLVHLTTNRHRVVTKGELLDVVWGDRFVSPATLTSRIRDLRAALGDSGRDQHTIRTVHGRGFQFVAEVSDRSTGGPVPTSPRTGSFADPDRSGSGASTVGVAAVVPTAPLLGREDEVRAVESLLEDHRIVTIVGPGGVGKTHLALHALGGSTDPVWFCDLSPVRDPRLLAVTCLEAVGVLEMPEIDAFSSLRETLGVAPCTLILDNCEHLIDDVADLIASIVDADSSTRVLATSRRPLRLRDERVVRLGPLDAHHSAELFVSAAAAHGVDVDGASPAIAQICSRLDGLPLAVELAASKTRAYPLDTIERLLDDRFEVLTTSARDEPEHHVSLATTLEWSFALMGPEARTTLQRMTAFVGSFDLDDAIALCGDGDDVAVVQQVLDLVDQSLVTFDPVTSRYRLLESIRLFAAEQLTADEGIELRRRHAEHFLAIVEQSRATLVGPDIDGSFAALRASWAEIRAAFAELIATERVGPAARLVAAIAPYAEMSYSFEVIEWTAEVDRLRAGGVGPLDPGVAGRVVATRSILLSHGGQFEQAADALQVAEAGPASSELFVARFWAGYFTGDVDIAQGALDRLLEDHRDCRDYHEALALTLQHYISKGTEQPVAADLLQRLARFSETGGEIGAISADLCAAVRSDWDADTDEVLATFADLIGRGRRLGFRLLVGGASTARSAILGMYADAGLGIRALRASLQTYADDRMWSFAMADLGAAALALTREGDAKHAAMLLGARAGTGYRGDVSEGVADTAEAETREALGERFDELFHDGTGWTARAATKLAIERLDVAIR